MKVRLLLGLLLLCPRPAVGAEILTVDARLSEAQLEVGDVLTLDIRAVAAVDGDVQIRLPPIQGMSVLGRSESTQVSMSWTSAGQTIRREKVVRVELSADQPGQVIIPPVVAEVGASKAESRPLEVMVTGNDSPAAAVATDDGEIVPPDPNETKLFVRYRLSQGSVWLGQQVLLDLEIFADPSSTFQLETIPDPPDLDGFWREVVERPKRLVPRTDVVQGRRYQVFRAWRLALFPLQAGQRTIEPVALSFRLGSGSLFGPGRRLRRRTRALELEVKPLPSLGRPAGFSPSNVGTYALTARVDERKVDASKALILKLSLSGEGNVKSARLPELKQIDGFRVFPPTVSEDIDLRPAGVHGTKTAEILLVPARTGELTIPSFRMSVFDPRAQDYGLLETDAIRVQVEGALPPSSAKAGPVVPPARPGATAQGDSSPRPLRYAAPLAPTATAPWSSGIWWAMVGAGPMLLGLIATLRAARTRSAKDDGAKARSALERLAKEKLVALETSATAGDPKGAAAAFTEAFYARAQARLELSLRGQTSDGAARALIERGADEAYARAVAQALETASFTRYAGGTVGDLTTTAREWSALVEGIDKGTYRGER